MTINSDLTTATLNRFSTEEASKKHTVVDEVVRALSHRAPHKQPETNTSSLLDAFVQSFKELETYK